MATELAALRIETDAANDAISDLKIITSKLAMRHGSEFRFLEKQIEELSYGSGEVFKDESLSGGQFLIAAGPKLTAIFVEARRLGLLV